MLSFLSYHALSLTFYNTKNFVARNLKIKNEFLFAYVVQKHLSSNKIVLSKIVHFLKLATFIIGTRICPATVSSEIFRISEWGKERKFLKQVYWLI